MRTILVFVPEGTQILHYRLHENRITPSKRLSMLWDKVALKGTSVFPTNVVGSLMVMLMVKPRSGNALHHAIVDYISIPVLHIHIHTYTFESNGYVEESIHRKVKFCLFAN